jgi:ATPase subunit of ABC transporter with duplicated ATPase domains
MVGMGFSKLVAQCGKCTLPWCLDIRPLITREIQTHLGDFNLDAEFGTQGKIRQLSGGQQVLYFSSCLLFGITVRSNSLH